ncbi:MAG: hypothetical protein JW932_07500 [Deltaproteobacteria bacterium]|nr:hypothetical protein [Deltaproteobacteria bacterium]
MHTIARLRIVIFKPTLFILLGLVYSIASFQHDAFAEIYGRFIGWKACQECHTEISNGWARTRHASAFESLVESGQQDLPDCLRCHVVAYDRPGGFLDPDLTMELAGVQCESCHGPGKKHLYQTEGSASIIREPTVERCRTCHTTGQDPDFDYTKKAASIHGELSVPSSTSSFSPKTSSSSSRLFVDQTLFELPSVDEGVPVIVNVFLKNIGSSDIRVTDLVTS